MKEGQRNFDLPLSNKDQNNEDTEMPASDLKLEILSNAEIQNLANLPANANLIVWPLHPSFITGIFNFNLVAENTKIKNT